MRKCLIFLFAAAFLVVSVMPATAQDDGSVSISGGAMIETLWNNVDSTMNAARGNGAFSDTDLTWAIVGPGTSITFRFKQGDISGHYQLRPFMTSPSQVFGAWNFGAGTLTIGNFNTPFQRPQAGLHSLGGNAHFAGNIDFISRNQGLMLTFPLGGGTLKFAALKPSSNTGAVAVVTVANGALAGAADTDTVIPKLEASYDVKFGGFNLWVGGGYQTYSEVVTSTDKEYDLDSWGLGIYGSYGFGPVTVNASLHRLQNPVQYGFTGGGPRPSISWVPTANATYNSIGDAIIDADLTGFHISAGWKLSDMLTLQAGYGGNSIERDPDTGAGEITDAEDATAFYYINMPIFAAKGLTITPEIGVRDEDDVTSPTTGLTTEQGKTTYYGVRWFIRF